MLHSLDKNELEKNCAQEIRQVKVSQLALPPTAVTPILSFLKFLDNLDQIKSMRQVYFTIHFIRTIFRRLEHSILACRFLDMRINKTVQIVSGKIPQFSSKNGNSYVPIISKTLFYQKQIKEIRFQ